MTIKEKSRHFSDEQLSFINKGPIPHHIAIIPDGNRRWAKQHKLQSILGHRRGCDILTPIIEAAKEIGIRVLTIYAFSTENWFRPKREVNALFKILYEFLQSKRETMIEEGIRFHTIGDPTPLPELLLREIGQTKQATESSDQLDLVLAINYGSRDELKRTILQIFDDYKEGLIQRNEITEQQIDKYLDTSPWDDPDMLIRTSGEQRISNFLLWQLSYAEIYSPKKLWPDFSPSDLLQAVVEYQKRQRRVGR